MARPVGEGAGPSALEGHHRYQYVRDLNKGSYGFVQAGPRPAHRHLRVCLHCACADAGAAASADLPLCGLPRASWRPSPAPR